jgi:hypothetical protein
VGAQEAPTPFAARNAEGAVLRARVPPMHYEDKLKPAPLEGRDWTRKRGCGWKRIDTLAQKKVRPMSAEIIDLGHLQLKQHLARSVPVLDARGVSIPPGALDGPKPESDAEFAERRVAGAVEMMHSGDFIGAADRLRRTADSLLRCSLCRVLADYSLELDGHTNGCHGLVRFQIPSVARSLGPQNCEISCRSHECRRYKRLVTVWGAHCPAALTEVDNLSFLRKSPPKGAKASYGGQISLLGRDDHPTTGSVYGSGSLRVSSLPAAPVPLSTFSQLPLQPAETTPGPVGWEHH